MDGGAERSPFKPDAPSPQFRSQGEFHDQPPAELLATVVEADAPVHDARW